MLQRLKSIILLTAGLVLASLPIAVHATELDDIISKKKIIIGSVTDYPPFAYLDENQKPAGYEIDVGNLLAKYLGVEAEFVPVNSGTRIPYLLSGKADIILSIFNITPQRALQVAYSTPYAVSGVVLLAPKSLELTSIDQLKGKRVSIVRGSTMETEVKKVAPEGTRLLDFDTTSTGVQALIAGQVDVHASGLPDLVLFQKARPDLNVELKLRLTNAPNGIGVRREHTDLLRWLNTTLLVIKNNGELDAIHRKWFGAPLPDLPVL